MTVVCWAYKRIAKETNKPETDLEVRRRNSLMGKAELFSN